MIFRLAEQLIYISLAALFVVFGLEKALEPAGWAAYLPPLIKQLLPFLATPMAIQIQGVIEFIIGLALLVSPVRRLAAGLATLVLLAVTASLLSIGAFDLALRDFVALSLALYLTARG